MTTEERIARLESIVFAKTPPPPAKSKWDEMASKIVWDFAPGVVCVWMREGRSPFTFNTACDERLVVTELRSAFAAAFARAAEVRTREIVEWLEKEAWGGGKYVKEKFLPTERQP